MSLSRMVLSFIGDIRARAMVVVLTFGLLTLAMFQRWVIIRRRRMSLSRCHMIRRRTLLFLRVIRTSR